MQTHTRPGQPRETHKCGACVSNAFTSNTLCYASNVTLFTQPASVSLSLTWHHGVAVSYGHCKPAYPPKMVQQLQGAQTSGGVPYLQTITNWPRVPLRVRPGATSHIYRCDTDLIKRHSLSRKAVNVHYCLNLLRLSIVSVLRKPKCT